MTNISRLTVFMHTPQEILPEYCPLVHNSAPFCNSKPVSCKWDEMPVNSMGAGADSCFWGVYFLYYFKWLQNRMTWMNKTTRSRESGPDWLTFAGKVGNGPLKELPGKWIWLYCYMAGCTVTTQLLTTWLSVAWISWYMAGCTMTTQLFTTWLSVAWISWYMAGCTMTTQLLTTWLSVAQIMLTQGRLHSDHTTTLLSVAQIMFMHGRMHNDHTTTHNVAECGTDHVDAVHVRRGWHDVQPEWARPCWIASVDGEMEGLLYNQWNDNNDIVGEQYVNMIKFKIHSGMLHI